MKHLSVFSRGCIAALILYLTLAGTAAWAQAPAWQAALGATDGSLSVNAITVDAAGNVYMVGTILANNFPGSVAFGSIRLSGNANTTGFSEEMFVAKWSPVTNDFVWAKVSRSQGGNTRGYGVAVSGNSVYVTGYLRNSAHFETISASSDYPSTYVVKLTDTGTSASFAWVQVVEARVLNVPMVVAANGPNVYVAGNMYQYSSPGYPTATPIRFGTISLPGPATYSESFVAKLTDAGNSGGFTWVQRVKVGNTNAAVALAANGPNVYLAGTASGTATFGSVSMPSTSTMNGYVAKIVDAGANGDFVWAQPVGEASTARAMAVAVSGANVYVAGNFTGTASFGVRQLTSIGASDAFVAKVADVGSTPSTEWAQRGGGTGDDGFEALAVNGQNIYPVGHFATTADFGATSMTSAGGTDVMVARITDTGSTSRFAWTQQAGGPGNEYGASVAVGSNNTVYVSGSGNNAGGSGYGAINFGSYALSTKSTGFFASLTDNVVVTANQSAGLDQEIAVYPNPAHARVAVGGPATPGATTATLALLDALGRTVRIKTVSTNARTELDLTGLAPGIYALRVTAGPHTATRRLVVE